MRKCNTGYFYNWGEVKTQAITARAIGIEMLETFLIEYIYWKLYKVKTMGVF